MKGYYPRFLSDKKRQHVCQKIVLQNSALSGRFSAKHGEPVFYHPHYSPLTTQLVSLLFIPQTQVCSESCEIQTVKAVQAKATKILKRFSEKNRGGKSIEGDKIVITKLTNKKSQSVFLKENISSHRKEISSHNCLQHVFKFVSVQVQRK